LSKVLIVFTLLFSVQSFADVTCEGGITFSDSVRIRVGQGQTVDLNLNGVGLYRVLVFNVFYGALYLQQTSTNGDWIIQSKQYKVGMIHANMNIRKNQMVNLWNDEFDRLCGSPQQCSQMRPAHEEFLGYARDVKEGERMYLIHFPNRFEFETSTGETFPPIYNVEYGQFLQKVLIGPEPTDADLKKGLLGLKQVCS
jgi:hypothetical protein